MGDDVSTLRKLPWGTICFVLFVAGLTNGLYEIGYYRGHAAGATEMKCAIFGVVDSMMDGAPNPSETRLTRLGCRTDKSGKVVRS